MPLLLDTNALIWLREGNLQLGSRAKALSDEALFNGELYVSAFTFWEVGMLVAKRRLEIYGSLGSWRESVIAGGMREIPVSGIIAIASTEFRADFPNDPADRIIAATTMSIGATLVTADGRLLRWDGELDRHDARV